VIRLNQSFATQSPQKLPRQSPTAAAVKGQFRTHAVRQKRRRE
jgi:hypothetical protein